MPIHRGSNFYQWGNQTKYYYTPGNKKSRESALKKAQKQARAIYSSGYRGIRSAHQHGGQIIMVNPKDGSSVQFHTFVNDMTVVI